VVLLGGGTLIIAAGLASPFAHTSAGPVTMSAYRAGEIALSLSLALLVAAIAARIPRIRALCITTTGILLALASVFALSAFVNATEIVAVFNGLDATPGLAPFIVLAGQGFIAIDAVLGRGDRGLARVQPAPSET
jgi:hypothetical protein